MQHTFVSWEYKVGLLLIISLGILIYSSPLRKREKNGAFLIVSMAIALFLIVARDSTVGDDTLEYERMFIRARATNFKDLVKITKLSGSSAEIGYLLLEKLVGFISNDAQVLFAICGTVFICGIYLFIRDNCDDMVLSVFSFLGIIYLSGFSQIRQCLAAGLCWIAWEVQKKNKTALAILIIILATTFHRSAIFFLSALFINRMAPNKKNFYIIVLGLSFLVFAGRSIIEFVVELFPVFEIYAHRYGKGDWQMQFNGVILFWILVFIIILLTVTKMDWNTNNRKRYFEAISFSSFYLAFCLMGISFDSVNRLSLYFQPFLLVLIDSCEKFWKGSSRILYIIGILAFMIVWFLRGASVGTYAYTFFW